ncbi:MAG: hypothetical protein LRY73_09235 [Bacillus sp. (in: Bacteria)]|nr:hypothetical protein [Bacillus sp. (in: firmicutes)]
MEQAKSPRPPSLKEIQHALFIVNRHAKTALDSRELYDLKKRALKKLLRERMAEKVGLEFSKDPRYGLQSSVVLVKVGTATSESTFYFHMLAEKEDFKLKHRGKINEEIRNPRVSMPFETAKRILYRYLGESGPVKQKKQMSEKEKRLKSVFVSSYLDGRKY